VNTILGIASVSELGEGIARARLRLAETERGAFRDYKPRNARLAWGSTSNGGVVLGYAESAGIGLAYLGSIHHPFPAFGDGSPLDDPDRTARALLLRYHELGLSFLADICGHFAVIVAEPRAERVTLARGHGSATRWYYAMVEGRLAFSTKLADLVPLLGEQAALDRSHEDFLLGYEFLPGGRTPLEGVRELLAGKLLEWRGGAATFHELKKPAPWGRRYADIDYRDENQVIEALHGAFESALREQAPACSKVGVLLGGVDSALIAARLAAIGKDVHTFSFRYADDSYNQAYTDELASKYGLTHHWVPITPEVVREGLEHYPQRFSQVLSQPHYVIATAHVCRAARAEGILHCLTGDGCDGLFLGYPTVHFRAKLIQNLSRMTPVIGKPLEFVTALPWLELKLGHPYRIARNVSRILRRPLPARGHVAACTLDATALGLLRDEPAPPQAAEIEDILRELAQGLEGVGSIRLAYLGKGRVGLNMVKLDGASSFAGVSLNSPYLHQGLAAMAGSIPDDLSRPERASKSKATGKYAFMSMIERNELLPLEMIYQKKRSPVMAPVDDWYWTILRSFMLSRFQHLPFSVDRRYAESLLTPKLAERVFRDKVGISRYVTPAAGLLATYAGFSQLLEQR